MLLLMVYRGINLTFYSPKKHYYSKVILMANQGHCFMLYVAVVTNGTSFNHNKSTDEKSEFSSAFDINPFQTGD